MSLKRNQKVYKAESPRRREPQKNRFEFAGLALSAPDTAVTQPQGTCDRHPHRRHQPRHRDNDGHRTRNAETRKPEHPESETLAFNAAENEAEDQDRDHAAKRQAPGEPQINRQPFVPSLATRFGLHISEQDQAKQRAHHKAEEHDPTAFRRHPGEAFEHNHGGAQIQERHHCDADNQHDDEGQRERRAERHKRSADPRSDFHAVEASEVGRGGMASV